MENNMLLLVPNASKQYFIELKKNFFNQFKAEIISSQSEFEGVKINPESYSVIIITAELDWKSVMSDFMGFDIALELRRKNKILTPIIIISMMEKSYFEYNASRMIKFQLLFGRGTAYSLIESLHSEFKIINERLKQYPITNATLIDMNEMLHDQRGIIVDKLTHELRFDKVKRNPITLNSILDNISAYLFENQRLSIRWDEYSKLLSETLQNIDEFNRISKDLINACEVKLISNTNPSKTECVKKHRLLFIEDDPDFQKNIKKNLSEHFSEIIAIDNAEEAIRIIDQDTNNLITGVIADWRLYSNFHNKTYWQLQGYEVLMHVARNHYAALFALTSLSDYNVHNIRNSLGLDVHLFKKQHLDRNDSDIQWEMMADIITQKCDTIVEIISSQPTGNTWKNFKNDYICLRNVGWSIYENKISDEATKLYKYYIKAIDDDNTRNVYSINEQGIQLKNNLENILIIRRVYLGIYFVISQKNIRLQNVNINLLGDGTNIDPELKHHSIDTYSLLRKDWWDDIENGLDSTKINSEIDKYNQRMKNLRGTLCIELSELPGRGLLPEEKSWLKNNNVDFSFMYNYF